MMTRQGGPANVTTSAPKPKTNTTNLLYQENSACNTVCPCMHVALANKSYCSQALAETVGAGCLVQNEGM